MSGRDGTLLGGPPPPSGPAYWQRRKITPAQAEEIRRRYAEGETRIALAAEFGVSVGTIGWYVEPRGRS